MGRTAGATNISNVTTSGTITFGVSGSPVAGYARMGGMTGENQGTITNSYTTANVSAYQNSVPSLMWVALLAIISARLVNLIVQAMYFIQAEALVRASGRRL